ncbi:APC family permease [Georgenia thermotolerans]|uniref:Amino acid permease n=1 Tax=Georgenia thermotolerans TaxID=527326 RepID=A0A7J5UKV7_9MICO|nr:APC family permease [Georgenia thermotolerans]KAE8762774.1 amino acid permease [Georgenia thermotolerans]
MSAPSVPDLLKRALVGRPVRSESMAATLLPKRIALPVFASDALSSVAYAPDEILLTLSLAGMAAVTLAPWVGLAVVVVMMAVVASYRQTVHAYPSGGGGYAVVRENLGHRAGMVVASALLVDYVLTVAVSVSSGAQYLAAALPAARGHEVVLAVAIVAVLMVLNLRGVRESGTAFAIPTYAFIGAIGLMILVGLWQVLTGRLEPAASAGLTLVPDPAFTQGLTGLAGGFLVLRAFSSGSAALTGIEAVSNGVPAFRRPKARNAATTLLLLGLIAVTMFMSILLLAGATGLRIAQDPATQLLDHGRPVGPGYAQDPVISQIAATVFRGAPALFVLVTVTTGFILVLAANTAFNGFPSLGSVLARDGYLPRQMHTRGDRLAFSNGIVLLAAVACAFIVAFGAEVTRLIQLYIVGVFVTFTLSQLGMVRHWGRLLPDEQDRRVRMRMRRARAINAFGAVLTAVVLGIVLATKFTHGAWITVLLMGLVFLGMRGIARHYDTVARDITVLDPSASRALPPRVHGIVLVSKLHEPAMRAIAYARATRPTTLEAVTVNIDDDDTAALRRAWQEFEIPVPLTVLDSPFREITRPVVNHVRAVRWESPRDLVVVFVPEYVVSHWWEQLLHNQSALRLKARLLFTPGVIMASVPFQLHEADHPDRLARPPLPRRAAR